MNTFIILKNLHCSRPSRRRHDAAARQTTTLIPQAESCAVWRTKSYGSGDHPSFSEGREWRHREVEGQWASAQGLGQQVRMIIK